MNLTKMFFEGYEKSYQHYICLNVSLSFEFLENFYLQITKKNNQTKKNVSFKRLFSVYNVHKI